MYPKHLGCVCGCGGALGIMQRNACAVGACAVLASGVPALQCVTALRTLCMHPHCWCIRRGLHWATGMLLAARDWSCDRPWPNASLSPVRCTTAWTWLPACPCYSTGNAFMDQCCTVLTPAGCQPVVRRHVPRAVQAQVRQVPARVRPQIRENVDATPRATFVTCRTTLRLCCTRCGSSDTVTIMLRTTLPTHAAACMPPIPRHPTTAYCFHRRFLGVPQL